jgi:hypothetical protein
MVNRLITSHLGKSQGELAYWSRVYSVHVFTLYIVIAGRYVIVL